MLRRDEHRNNHSLKRMKSTRKRCELKGRDANLVRKRMVSGLYILLLTANGFSLIQNQDFFKKIISLFYLANLVDFNRKYFFLRFYEIGEKFLMICTISLLLISSRFLKYIPQKIFLILPLRFR